MASTLLTPHSESNSLTPGFSCFTCRQRKIKCDRQNPCTNCVKAAKPCSFVAPVRGKRKRTKPPKEGLHAKLRRYEELLESHGVRVDSKYDDGSDQESTASGDIDMAGDAEPQDPKNPEASPVDESRFKLITKDGSSRYFDTGVWSDVKDEIHPDAETMVDSIDASNALASDSAAEYDENALVLNGCARIANLHELHPPAHTLEFIKAIFLERVDPLTRILHIPTFWKAITDTIKNPRRVSKCLEVLIFAVYFTAFSSMEDDECQRVFYETSSNLVLKYKSATHQALVNVRFLETSSLMVLQAFELYIMGMRAQRHGESLYVLSGIGVRLARKMGLHKDGTTLGLSPFDTEIRRRLWHHIFNADCGIADFIGTKPSMDVILSDTKAPLNVEDEDIYPDMESPPPERTGITSMVLRLIKHDILTFFQDSMPNSVSGCGQLFLDPSVAAIEKDRKISQLQDMLEKKYIRYCDPSNPLHFFASIMCRMIVCNMKVLAHMPRGRVNAAKVSQKVLDSVLTNGLKLLEYVNLMQTSSIVRRFVWQIGNAQIWFSIVYVLMEARRRKTGPEVDRIWEKIEGIFSQDPKWFPKPREHMYAALSNWMVQVWHDCATARKAKGYPAVKVPDYIISLHKRQKSMLESNQAKTAEPKAVFSGTTSNSEAYLPGEDNIFAPMVELNEPLDFPNLMSFDMDPTEWGEWERIFNTEQITA